MEHLTRRLALRSGHHGLLQAHHDLLQVHHDRLCLDRPHHLARLDDLLAGPEMVIRHVLALLDWKVEKSLRARGHGHDHVQVGFQTFSE